MGKFKVLESHAETLLGREWVNSTRTEMNTTYHKGKEWSGPVVSELRLIIHYAGSICDKDGYNNACLAVTSDPLFEGADVKFIRTFYDTCIYLTCYDEDKNRIDVIISHCLKGKELAKFYSDISGCDMKRTVSRLDCGDWSCGVK